MIMKRKDGGPGSGNFGHSGRPGERGGSGKSGGAGAKGKNIIKEGPMELATTHITKGKAQKVGAAIAVIDAYDKKYAVDDDDPNRPCWERMKLKYVRKFAEPMTKAGDIKSVEVACAKGVIEEAYKEIEDDIKFNYWDEHERHVYAYEYKRITECKQAIEPLREVMNSIKPQSAWGETYTYEGKTFVHLEYPNNKSKRADGGPGSTDSGRDIPFGVGVLVTDGNGNFLCGIRGDNHQICGPGGHIEKDEAPRDAAIRETKEEFGITPKNLIELGAIHDGKNYNPSMVYLCTDYEGEVRSDDKEMYFPTFANIKDLEDDGVEFHPAFADSVKFLQDCLSKREDGGPGSGNFGHSGRPGQRGGSGKGGGKAAAAAVLAEKSGGYGGLGSAGEVKSGKNGNFRPKSDGARRIDTKDALADIKGDPARGIPPKENSLSAYLDEDGNLSPERQAVHDEIIRKFFEDKVAAEGQPTMIMSGGGPASGKSFITNRANNDFGEETVVKIDPDEFKAMLPGYRDMAIETENAAPYYHEESSALAKRAYQYAADNGVNVVYDGTGDGSIKSVESKIAIAREAGYAVKAQYVTVDTEEAVVRNVQRYEKAMAKWNAATEEQRANMLPPRLPPEKMVRDTHAKVSEIAPQVANKFDSFELYDNNGPEGSPKVLIATCSKGGKIQSESGQDVKVQNFLDKCSAGARVENGAVVMK